MKQPEELDVGTKMDVARQRLIVAREDLDTAKLTFEAGKFRAANNRAYSIRIIFMLKFFRESLAGKL